MHMIWEILLLLVILGLIACVIALFIIKENSSSTASNTEAFGGSLPLNEDFPLPKNGNYILSANVTIVGQENQGIVLRLLLNGDEIPGSARQTIIPAGSSEGFLNSQVVVNGIKKNDVIRVQLSSELPGTVVDATFSYSTI